MQYAKKPGKAEKRNVSRLLNGKLSSKSADYLRKEDCAIMSSEGKKHLSKMLALCRTIVEGAKHLALYKEDSILKPDTITGLRTLEVSLESFGAYSSIKVTRLLEACIENDIYLHDREFESILLYWYSSVSKTILTLFTSESLLCPICNGPGRAAYIAYSYREQETDSFLRLSGLWMRCSFCGNYYCVKKSPPKALLRMRSSEIMPDYTNYIHMADTVKKNVRDGFILFVGDGQAKIFPLLSIDNYILHTCTLKNLEKAPENVLFYERYQAILIEDLSAAKNMGSILKNTINCLKEGGLLLFDMPDLEMGLQTLSSTGTAVTFNCRGDVILVPSGLEKLKNELGVDIISCRKNDEMNRIEFVIKKIRQTYNN